MNRYTEHNMTRNIDRARKSRRDIALARLAGSTTLPQIRVWRSERQERALASYEQGDQVEGVL